MDDWQKRHRQLIQQGMAALSLYEARVKEIEAEFAQARTEAETLLKQSRSLQSQQEALRAEANALFDAAVKRRDAEHRANRKRYTDAALEANRRFLEETSDG